MNLLLLLLRLVVGLTFSAHGAQKLFGAFGGGGLDGTAQMFEKLGLQPQKKTKTGFSTDAASLEKLRGQHPIIDLLLRYREVEKLRSTYGESLLAEVEPDGRIRATFNQTVARSGFEYNLVLIAAVVALAGIGAGAWSLDGALGVGLTGTGWALAALGVGVVGGVASVVGGHRYPEAAHRGPGVRTPA